MQTILQHVHPLFFIGLAVLGIGLFTIRREPKSRTVGIFFALAGAFLVLLTGYPLVFGSPAEVAAVREADPDRIVAFEIGPTMGRPSAGELTGRTIRVTDRERIEVLVSLLRTSTYAAPNHPDGRWATRLVLDNGRERHEARVAWTRDGLLVSFGGGGVGRDFRQEKLKGFLEQIARENP